ncbi:MAG: P1 family peptidase [Candidatus Aminicenantes bacterium]
MKTICQIIVLVLLLSSPTILFPKDPVRARNLGIPFNGVPGPDNAISDVNGVEVGHVTLNDGEGDLKVGVGPVRTGVTVVLPQGKTYEPVPAGWFSLNGNGEMTGTTWISESGFLEGPVVITNTHSVGIARDAVIEWGLKNSGGKNTFSLPVVAETWDGFLNDINGFHVTKKHVFQALDNARPGPVPEGNVGGGTGMRAYDFKAGIGTASRILPQKAGGYTVGVLVQANFGRRKHLYIAGVPVGQEIRDLMPVVNPTSKNEHSIIAIAATNAPLLPHQLDRLAKRVSLGIARTGGISTNSSGDIFIAFSTARPQQNKDGIMIWHALPDDKLDYLFIAVIQATEEAIINSLVAARTMKGINGNTFYAIPHDRLKNILKKYNRLLK